MLLQPASLLTRAERQSLVMLDCDDWLEEHLPPGLVIQRLPTGGTPGRPAGLVPQLVTSPAPPESIGTVAARLTHMASAVGFGAEGEARALVSTALHLRDATLRWPTAFKAERAALAAALQGKAAMIPTGEWPDGLDDLARASPGDWIHLLHAEQDLAHFLDNMLGAVPPGLVRMLGATLADGRVPCEPDAISDDAGLPPASETWPLSLSYVLLPVPAPPPRVLRAVLQFRAGPAS